MIIMTDSNTGSGAPTTGSGAPVGTIETKPNTTAVISPEDHKRAIDDAMKFKAELKATRDKLEEFEKKERASQEKKLLEDGEFQKLIAVKETRISELETKVNELHGKENDLRKTLFDAAKLNAVRERLPGSLKHPAYMNFIDIEKVAINPETNQIDMSSVEAVVASFVKEHPDLLKTDPIKLPNGTAQVAAGKLTHAEWTKLPPKEKRERLKDVEGFLKKA